MNKLNIIDIYFFLKIVDIYFEHFQNNNENDFIQQIQDFLKNMNYDDEFKKIEIYINKTNIDCDDCFCHNNN